MANYFELSFLEKNPEVALKYCEKHCEKNII